MQGWGFKPRHHKKKNLTDSLPGHTLSVSHIPFTQFMFSPFKLTLYYETSNKTYCPIISLRTTSSLVSSGTTFYVLYH